MNVTINQIIIIMTEKDPNVDQHWCQYQLACWFGASLATTD